MSMTNVDLLNLLRQITQLEGYLLSYRDNEIEVDEYVLTQLTSIIKELQYCLVKQVRGDSND